MSTIKTDLLQNRLGTSHPAVTKADFVKCWGFYDSIPATPVIMASFNVSFLTDMGVGILSSNYTAPFTSGVYSALVSCTAKATLVDNFNDVPTRNSGSAHSRHFENAVACDTSQMDVSMKGTLA